MGPKTGKRSHPVAASILLILIRTLLVDQLARCSQLVESDLPSQQDLRSLKLNEPHHQNSFPDNKPTAIVKSRNTSVADLSLTADFRAAKLRWIYRLDQAALASGDQQVVEPASFDVR